LYGLASCPQVAGGGFWSMNFSNSSPTIFCTRTKQIVGVCKGSAEDAAERLVKLRSEYGPDLVVVSWEEAWECAEAAARTEPVEINEKAWVYALNVLPPLAWQSTADAESFKVSEPIQGTIVSIYVRLGDRRFTFDDSARLRHEECCARVRDSRAFADKADDCSAKPTPEPEEGPSGHGWPLSRFDKV